MQTPISALGFSSGCGVVCSGKSNAFVEVLGDHAASSERKLTTGRFSTLKKFYGCRGGAAGIDKRVTDRRDGFVKVKRIFWGEDVR